MSGELFRLTWADFDRAADLIAAEFAGAVGAVYGAPRGGLPLAVALSHRLGVPLAGSLAAPEVLWVDDIVDTGQTLAVAKAAHPRLRCAAWVRRGDHAVFAPITLQTERWVLFPWELESAATKDALAYALSH